MSTGLKQLVTWMEAEIKKQQLAVESAVRQERAMGGFEDCGDFYRENLVEARAKLEQMVSWKISTEKFMKKLQHEAREAANAVFSGEHPVG